MSTSIGYGASAIRAGEQRYQEAVTNLVKEAAHKRPEEDSHKAVAKEQSARESSHKVDVKA